MSNGKRSVAILLLVVSLSNAGCYTMYPRYLGVRPDAPDITPRPRVVEECARRHPSPSPPAADPTRTACEQYLDHVLWAQQLAESYRTRATMNEWAIYLAGTIALAGLSVVGGLGVAAAASVETIGLIGVSTGFTAGFFGFMNNPRRAGFYTDAANKISTALASGTQVVADPTKPNYDLATQQLASAISTAANNLEKERFEAARDAARSAEVADAQEKLRVLQTGLLVSLDQTSGQQGTAVVATVAGVDMDKYKASARVHLDSFPTVAVYVSQTQVKFTVPTIPVPKPASVKIQLYVADNIRVPGELPFTITP